MVFQAIYSWMKWLCKWVKLCHSLPSEWKEQLQRGQSFVMNDTTFLGNKVLKSKSMSAVKQDWLLLLFVLIPISLLVVKKNALNHGVVRSHRHMDMKDAPNGWRAQLELPILSMQPSPILMKMRQEKWWEFIHSEKASIIAVAGRRLAAGVVGVEVFIWNEIDFLIVANFGGDSMEIE